MYLLFDHISGTNGSLSVHINRNNIETDKLFDICCV